MSYARHDLWKEIHPQQLKTGKQAIHGRIMVSSNESQWNYQTNISWSFQKKWTHSSQQRLLANIHSFFKMWESKWKLHCNSEISFLQSRAKKVHFWDNKNCDKYKKLSQFIFSFQKMQNFDLHVSFNFCVQYSWVDYFWSFYELLHAWELWRLLLLLLLFWIDFGVSFFVSKNNIIIHDSMIFNFF
jgi:hypothetical protein